MFRQDNLSPLEFVSQFQFSHSSGVLDIERKTILDMEDSTIHSWQAER